MDFLHEILYKLIVDNPFCVLFYENGLLGTEVSFYFTKICASQ